MGSPMVANFYMERFEELVIQSVPFKLKCWFRYMDDTFVIWRRTQEL